MNIKCIALALALGCAVGAQAAADKIVGYFPYWSQYSQFYPKDVRYKLLTHIHYASIAPSSDGSLAFADDSDVENFKELVKLSGENNVKLIISIGGMETEGAFQEIAASEETRSAFAQNVASWLAENGGNGVELDWQNLTSDDAENYSALVEALLSALGSNYTLSAAVYPLTSTDAYSGDLLNKLDYVSVFTPDQMTEEESELKPNQSVVVVNEAVSALESKGVDKGKMVPVVTLYGKTFASATGLGSSHEGIGSGNEGYLSYKELMEKFEKPDYTVTFDEASKSEVAVSAMDAVVFMGIPSVKALSEQAKSELGGVAVYELAQDHPEPLVSLLVTIGLELRPELDYKPAKKK